MKFLETSDSNYKFLKSNKTQNTTCLVENW